MLRGNGGCGNRVRLRKIRGRETGHVGLAASQAQRRDKPAHDEHAVAVVAPLRMPAQSLQASHPVGPMREMLAIDVGENPRERRDLGRTLDQRVALFEAVRDLFRPIAVIGPGLLEKGVETDRVHVASLVDASSRIVDGLCPTRLLGDDHRGELLG